MNSTKLFTTLLPVFGANVVFADLTVDTAIPSGTGVIATSSAFGTTGSRIFDIDANPNHARGNRFTLGESGGTTFRIDSVTIQSAGAQVFDNDTLTLYIYQGTAAQWNSGTGRVASNPDFYTGTTVTPLTSESFVVTETLAGGNYLTFELTTPIVVDENQTYGFFFTYEQGDGGLTSLFYREAGSPLDSDFGRTSTTATSHSTATSREVNHWIQGEAIDPGITDSTLTPSDTLISTGEIITLDITFDPTVDTAELTITPASTTIDLKALDDGVTNGDLLAGDGIVSLDSDVLTATLTYQVEVTKTGQTSETVTSEVIVVDPAAVADTALSSAILADAPVFYYRFEEAVDAGYVIDYSGNDFHADDLVGTLVQGTSSSGVGNAIEMNGDGGIRTPASQNMSQPFTFTAIVDVDEFPSASLRNILSNADGGAGRVGRSILGTQLNGLTTEISSLVSTLTDTSIVTEQTAVLLHMVSETNATTTDREVRIYLNGILYSTTTIGNIGPNVGNWILGGNKILNGDFYDGLMDETAMFDVALSDAQIAAHGEAFLGLATDPFLGFFTDSPELEDGTTGNLFVMVSDSATGASYDDGSGPIAIDISSGAGAYPVPISPTVDTTYNLVVTGPGGPFMASTSVVIVAPPADLIITSCSIDDSTPPVITIEFTGAADTAYDIYASKTLDFDTDKVLVATGVLTDASGVGTTMFPGEGLAEFYRVELP